MRIMSNLYLKAYRFAMNAHMGQTRGDGVTPYITHPVEVAAILSANGELDHTLAAALLHDVIEDCGVTHAQLLEQFGERVANLVDEVSDPPGMTKNQRRERQLVMIPMYSREALMIKMADKTANLSDSERNPPDWPQDRIDVYRAFCKEFLRRASERLQTEEA